MKRNAVLLCLLTFLTSLANEKVNIKTNLLNDLAGSMNLAVEAPLGGKTSFELSGNYNPFSFSEGVMWKHWSLKPEFRYWFGKERLRGHFFGIHAIGGEFNFNKATLLYNSWPDLRDHRIEGWGIGGGLTYGYRWNFNSRWGMEAHLGVGAVYTRYNKYRCGKCGERLSRGNRTYVGPTDVAVSLVYRFGPKKTVPVNPVEERIVERLRIDTVTIERLRVDTVYRNVLQESPVKLSVSASHDMHLRYRLNSSEIDPSLADNGVQIDSLLNFIERCQNEIGLKVNTISIVGFASVEGNALDNLRLSDARARAAADLIAELRPELAPLINAFGRGEDWESLRFPGKSLIMRESDPDRRERKLRSLDGGRIYKELLENQFPATRRIECVIGFTILQ